MRCGGCRRASLRRQPEESGRSSMHIPRPSALWMGGSKPTVPGDGTLPGCSGTERRPVWPKRDEHGRRSAGDEAGGPSADDLLGHCLGLGVYS